VVTPVAIGINVEVRVPVRFPLPPPPLQGLPPIVQVPVMSRFCRTVLPVIFIPGNVACPDKSRSSSEKLLFM
jgi:hypothetical protein